MFGQDRPGKNATKYLLRSAEISSPQQTSSDETNDCVIKSEKGALVRGSDPPSVTVSTTRQVICGGRRRGV